MMERGDGNKSPVMPWPRTYQVGRYAAANGGSAEMAIYFFFETEEVELLRTRTPSRSSVGTVIDDFKMVFIPRNVRS